MRETHRTGPIWAADPDPTTLVAPRRPRRSPGPLESVLEQIPAIAIMLVIWAGVYAVSYTHLTLPTILRV